MNRRKKLITILCFLCVLEVFLLLLPFTVSSVHSWRVDQAWSRSQNEHSPDAQGHLKTEVNNTWLLVYGIEAAAILFNSGMIIIIYRKLQLVSH